MIGNAFEFKVINFLAVAGCAATEQILRLHPDLPYKTNHTKIMRMEQKMMIQRVGQRHSASSGPSAIIWCLTPSYCRWVSNDARNGENKPKPKHMFPLLLQDKGVGFFGKHSTRKVELTSAGKIKKKHKKLWHGKKTAA